MPLVKGNTNVSQTTTQTSSANADFSGGVKIGGDFAPSAQSSVPDWLSSRLSGTAPADPQQNWKMAGLAVAVMLGVLIFKGR